MRYLQTTADLLLGLLFLMGNVSKLAEQGVSARKRDDRHAGLARTL
jgi:hypothetical protein